MRDVGEHVHDRMGVSAWACRIYLGPGECHRCGVLSGAGLCHVCRVELDRITPPLAHGALIA